MIFGCWVHGRSSGVVLLHNCLLIHIDIRTYVRTWIRTYARTYKGEVCGRCIVVQLPVDTYRHTYERPYIDTYTYVRAYISEVFWRWIVAHLPVVHMCVTHITHMSHMCDVVSHTHIYIYVWNICHTYIGRFTVAQLPAVHTFFTVRVTYLIHMRDTTHVTHICTPLCSRSPVDTYV